MWIFAVDSFKRLQMLLGKRRALAEARHIGPQVIHPHVIGAVFILMRIGDRAFGKEQHVGFDAPA